MRKHVHLCAGGSFFAVWARCLDGSGGLCFFGFVPGFGRFGDIF